MKKIIITGGVALGTIVSAQEPPPPPFDKHAVTVMRSGDITIVNAVPATPVIPGVASSVAFGMTGGPFNRAMKNAPYSAETITESLQILGDGNKITSRLKLVTYRDSDGRVRSENISGTGAEEHKVISIEDPMAEVHYILDEKEKTATKIPLPKFSRQFVKVTPESATATASATSVRAWRPTSLSATAGMTAPLVTQFHGNGADKEDLGTQVIEGVNAKGVKYSFTIPEGQIGNEKPIISVTENWFSEELGIQVLMKRTDPRFGDTTSRTTNIQRVEQPNHLFEVPSDYKIVEAERAPFPSPPPPPHLKKD